MFIEGGSHLGNKIRGVWHCELMKNLIVGWVDTDTAQYGELDKTKRMWTYVTKQAKKIVFDEPALMIYINPIADDEKEDVHGKETIEA